MAHGAPRDELDELLAELAPFANGQERELELLARRMNELATETSSTIDVDAIWRRVEELTRDDPPRQPPSGPSENG